MSAIEAIAAAREIRKILWADLQFHFLSEEQRKMLTSRMIELITQ